jgi:formate-dependent nitrite reductase membrane component NrfD
MASETSGLIKESKTLRPQHIWRWEIAVYLYMAGMGAGAFVIGMFVLWFMKPEVPITLFGFNLDIAKPALLWGPLFVAVGAPFLILDLGIKTRFIYACLNPRTSWLARGFFILSTFIVLGLIVFAVSILFPQLFNTRPTLWLVLEVISVIFAFSTAIYTGVLLKSVKYIPVWNTPLLPVLFLASALSTGSMGVILAMLGSELLFSSADVFAVVAHTVVGYERILIVIEAVVLAIYLYSRYRAKDQGETSVRLLLSGKLKPLFWGGIVLIGFVFPLALEYTYSCCPESPQLLYATGAFLLCGGFFLRLGVLASGVKEQLPMRKFMEMRYQLGVSNPTHPPDH